MSRDESGLALKQALASAVRVGAGRGYPPAIRARAAAYVQRRRGEGATDEAIGRELGISAMTFRRWVARRSTSGFVLATVDAPSVPPPGIVVHGPRGLRIAGLDLDGVVALWERLS